MPKLQGKTLKESKRRLSKSTCRIDDVLKLKGAKAATGKVVKQVPQPSAVRTPRLEAQRELGVVGHHHAGG